MTSRKNTKKALLASALSLLLCISMLIGSTYAWFTDTASTSVNTIQSGTLDVALEMKVDGEWVSAEGETLSFTENYWEPGCTYELPELRIVNNGNLALKYKVIITGINGDAKLNEAIEWTIGDVALGTEQHLLPEANIEFTISGHMKESAGNEYQNLTIEGISITVVATQYTYESDSNGNQYDKDAAYPVVVQDAQSFVDALNNPKATVIVVSDDITYDWGTNSYQNAQNLVMQNKIIRGATGNEVLTVKGYGSANNMKNVTLENLKVSDQTTGDNENSWEHGYLEVEDMIANNVEFLDGIQLNGNCVLTNCTFNGKTVDRMAMYGAWVNSGTSTFINCAFNGTRGLKTHEQEDYNTDVTAITVDGCTFTLSEKPGVVIGTVDSTTSITIQNSSFIGVPAGDQGKYFYESDTDVSKFNFKEENNTYFGTAVSGTLPSQAANNENVILTEDITGTGTISGIYKGTAAFIQDGGIIDGNGKTVTLTKTSYGVQTSGGTIKNLTIVSADRGIMINSANEDIYIDGVTVSDCGYGINTGESGVAGKKLIVTNSTINGWSSWAGGLESASFTNCSFGTSTYYSQENFQHVVRPYVTTAFINCDFEKGTYIQLDVLTGTVTLNNCTCNGVVLTNDNFADYVKIVTAFDASNNAILAKNGDNIAKLIWG